VAGQPAAAVVARLIRRPKAGRFAAAIAAVQASLGDHQDTVMAGAWLRATGAAVPQACIAAGER